MGAAVGEGRSQNQQAKRPHSGAPMRQAVGWAAHEAGGQQDATLPNAGQGWRVGRPDLRRGAGARPPPPRFQLCWSRGDSADQPDCRVSGSRGARPQTGGRGRVQKTQLSEWGRMHRLTAPHTWSESRVPQLKEHLPS